MKVAIACCLHGNETYGLEVVKVLSPKIPYFVGNMEALRRGIRFIDSDLNRSFPGSKNGNHEAKIAFGLSNQLKKFDYVIDVHSSSNHCPLFGIITKPNKKKIDFAKKLGLKRLVIMPKFFASGKALIDFVNCGISLEIGPHNGKSNVRNVLDSINNFLERKMAGKEMEIYEVFDVIKKEAPKVAIKNFEEVKKGQIIATGNKSKQFSKYDFVPVLVDEEAYNDVLCLACRRTNFKSEIIKNIRANSLAMADKDKQEDDDVYDEDEVEDELDDDEITEREAGMMEGFDRDEDKSFDSKKKKKK